MKNIRNVLRHSLKTRGFVCWFALHDLLTYVIITAGHHLFLLKFERTCGRQSLPSWQVLSRCDPKLVLFVLAYLPNLIIGPNELRHGIMHIPMWMRHCSNAMFHESLLFTWTTAFVTRFRTSWSSRTVSASVIWLWIITRSRTVLVTQPTRDRTCWPCSPGIPDTIN